MAGGNKSVVILAFNLGIKGDIVNGPGISLRNLLLFCERFYPNISFSVFSRFPVKDPSVSAECFSIDDKRSLESRMASADVVHCWSGLKNTFLEALLLANKLSRPVILGPNLLDTVEPITERPFVRRVKYDLILTANTRLKYLLAKTHGIDSARVLDFMVGPDLDLWKMPNKVDKYILWKGNARQPVKDIRFAKNVAKKLPKYKFMFIGEKSDFDYLRHIPLASHARLYINTSWSETKGMAQLEQMAAGVPSVVHPQIYCHGENYVTGIITNKTIENYVEAIREVLDDNQLRVRLRQGARKYVEDNYGPKKIADKYYKILEHVS